MDRNLKKIHRGSLIFFTQPVDIRKFTCVLDRIDSWMKKGASVKDSPTTTAVFVRLPCYEDMVFLKRTNRKNLRFVFRYLFRRARVFRAAKAADRLKEAGIPTPEVLAVGERRYGLFFLKAGYLITEVIHCARDGVSVAKAIDCGSLMKCTAGLLYRLHEAGVHHGDAKLQNFYFRGNVCGVWDLDGARCFRGKVPEKYRLIDLARLILSARAVTDQPFEILCEKALDAYPDIQPDDIVRTAEKYFQKLL